MKTIHIIDIHSVLDVITNSSSELFVIADDTEIKAVEETLQFMLDKYNEMAARGIFGKWYKDDFTPHKMEEVMEVSKLTQEDVDEHKDDDWGWGFEKQENVGKIIIRSIGDNSIPWEIVEWIESAFSARRWHLG